MTSAATPPASPKSAPSKLFVLTAPAADVVEEAAELADEALACVLVGFGATVVLTEVFVVAAADELDEAGALEEDEDEAEAAPVADEAAAEAGNG